MAVKLGSLTFREQHRLRVFENGVLSKILELNRDEIIGSWKKIA
jgi:hypothetical protein